METRKIDWRKKRLVYLGIERIMCAGDIDVEMEVDALGTADRASADLTLYHQQKLDAEAFYFYHDRAYEAREMGDC